MCVVLVLPLAVEYKGHLLLEAAVTGDTSKMRKLVSPKLVSFQHPLSLDTPLVSAHAP